MYAIFKNQTEYILVNKNKPYYEEYLNCLTLVFEGTRKQCLNYVDSHDLNILT